MKPTQIATYIRSNQKSKSIVNLLMEHEQNDPVGVPSECLLLKNMFEPSTEEHDLMDIREDAIDACSRFGQLNHIYLDKNSDGFVYLRYDNVQAAMNAQLTIHGNRFGGNIITATYMTTEAYEAKFPVSK